MIKKILKWAGIIAGGIFAFYLFIGWIVLPIAAPLVIKSQGAKILNTPVKVKSVTFNPFIWRLNVKGIQVLDAQEQTIAGFEKLRVNLSFLALFKKTIRVEEILLDGLLVHAILQPDGTINLMSLVPPPAAPAQPAPAEAAAPAEAPQPLPPVIVDLIQVSNGAVKFTDQSVQPNFSTVLGAININVTGVSTAPDALVKVAFDAKLDEKGVITAQTAVSPFVQPPQVEAAFSMDQYAMQILSPYTGKYTGRLLADGNMSLKMDYRIADNKIAAGHKLLIQRFTFGDKVDSKDALNLPFGLAVALLEDPQGRITISLPVKGDMSDPEFEYLHLLGQVASNFFIKLVTKPFSILASTFGSGEEGTEELGVVKFSPGSADLAAEERGKLTVLAKGLKERPKLKLAINGTFDPDGDWKAMKLEVFNRDLEALKKETTKGDHWVYLQLYERQFGVRDQWKLIKAHRAEDGTVDEAALHEAIKNEIIEFGEPDRPALTALAQSRAQLIYDTLVAEGFDAGRMSVGNPRQAQTSMGAVPLEFTLTVYGEEPPAEAAPAAVAPETVQ